MAASAIADAAAVSSAIDHAALYRLMTWLSPAFPVGAFSYSSGIEWAVEAGDITDAQTLKHWLAAMLTQGAGLNDAIFLAHAWRACADRDAQRLREAPPLRRPSRVDQAQHLADLRAAAAGGTPAAPPGRRTGTSR